MASRVGRGRGGSIKLSLAALQRMGGATAVQVSRARSPMPPAAGGLRSESEVIANTCRYSQQAHPAQGTCPADRLWL